MSEGFDSFEDRARRAASAIPASPLGDGDVATVRRRVRRSRGTTAAIATVLAVAVGAGGFTITRETASPRVYTPADNGPSVATTATATTSASSTSTTTSTEPTTTTVDYGLPPPLLPTVPVPTTPTTPPPTTPLPVATDFPLLVVAEDGRGDGTVRLVDPRGSSVVARARLRVAYRLHDGTIVGQTTQQVTASRALPTDIVRIAADGTVTTIPALRGSSLMGIGRRDGRELLFLSGPWRTDQADFLVYDLAAGRATVTGWAAGGDSGFGRASILGDVLLLSGSADMGVMVEYRNFDGTQARGPDLDPKRAYPSADVVSATAGPDGTIAFIDGPPYENANPTLGPWQLVVVDATSGQERLRVDVASGGERCGGLDYDGRWAVLSCATDLGRLRPAVVVDTSAADPQARQVPATVGNATLAH